VTHRNAPNTTSCVLGCRKRAAGPKSGPSGTKRDQVWATRSWRLVGGNSSVFRALGIGRGGYSQFLHRLCPNSHIVCPPSHIHQINSRVKALYDLFMGQIWPFLWLFSFLGSAGSHSLGYKQVALSYVVDIVVNMTQTVPPVPPSAAVSI